MSDLLNLTPASLSLEDLHSEAARAHSHAMFLDCKNAKTANEKALMRELYDAEYTLKAEIKRREKVRTA